MIALFVAQAGMASFFFAVAVGAYVATFRAPTRNVDQFEKVFILAAATLSLVLAGSAWITWDIMFGGV